MVEESNIITGCECNCTISISGYTEIFWKRSNLEA